MPDPISTRAQDVLAHRHLERAARWMGAARWGAAGIALVFGGGFYLLFVTHADQVRPTRALRGTIMLPLYVLGFAALLARPFNSWIADIQCRLRGPLIWATALSSAAAVTVSVLDGWFLIVVMRGPAGDRVQAAIVFASAGVGIVAVCLRAAWVFRTGWRSAERLAGPKMVGPIVVDGLTARRIAAQRRVERLGSFVEQLPWTLGFAAVPFVLLSIGCGLNLLMPLAAIVCFAGFREPIYDVGQRLRSRDRNAAIWAANFAIGVMIFSILLGTGDYLLLRRSGDPALLIIYPSGAGVMAVAALLYELRFRRAVRDIDELSQRAARAFEIIPGDVSTAAKVSLPPTPPAMRLPPRPRR